jgi:hypothetical protein
LKEVQGLGINPFVQTIRGVFVQQIEPAKDAMHMEGLMSFSAGRLSGSAR